MNQNPSPPLFIPEWVSKMGKPTNPGTAQEHVLLIFRSEYTDTDTKYLLTATTEWETFSKDTDRLAGKNQWDGSTFDQDMLEAYYSQASYKIVQNFEGEVHKIWVD